ncbi:LLM class flavin-dependent oxidoreductase [Cellulomonas taurus]|uniref:LLM class flavin-dependent oxidoreductase n=1 Tax=Cellulomonas taurus TaxID=2729175 RepID=UPI00145F03EC|nr:LLM class flavin-dependent oxidoreductase [Cellulomonas taurus]
MTDQRNVPLSVLDLSGVGTGRTTADALADSTRLAQAADRLGFHRFWVAEHHSMPAVASTSPAVLIAHLGAHTERIRLGSGGVMLPNHPSLVIAEQFAMLEALHPGRIDLGIGRAPGADQMTASALRRTGEEDFPAELVDVLALLGQPAAGLAPSPAATRLIATPSASGTPQVWLLGSSLYSAQLAARLGLAFSYAHHFNTGLTEQAAAAYRSGFQPSAVLDRPRFMVSSSVIVADSEERAAWLSGPSRVMMLRLRTRGPLAPVVTPEEAEQLLDTLEADPDGRAIMAQIPGTQITTTAGPAVAALRELVDRVDADELMLTATTYDVADRITTLEQIAERW